MYFALEELLNEMIASSEKNLQLDIFRMNGQVLLQVFKAEDVGKWDTQFKVRSDSLVFQLLFNKGKTDNQDNLERFKESMLFKDFEFVEFFKQTNYFSNVPIANGVISISEKIMKIINVVYGLRIDEARITLNAY